MGNDSSTNVDQPHTVKKKKRIFKIIVIGDSTVGKTCLSYRLCGVKIPINTGATVGVDFCDREIEIDGEPLKLLFWDTAGQERFRLSMYADYYRNVHAVVFVYDVTKIVSFQNLIHWISECKQHQVEYEEIPKFLIGNKNDCVHKIAVNASSARKFAKDHHMSWFETSATDDQEADYVDSIFMTLACKLNNKPMMQSTLSESCSNHGHKLNKKKEKESKCC